MISGLDSYSLLRLIVDRRLTVKRTRPAPCSNAMVTVADKAAYSRYDPIMHRLAVIDPLVSFLFSPIFNSRPVTYPPFVIR